jgi:hypothetical protein
MSKIIALSLILFQITFFAHSQEQRIVCGTLKDKDRGPLAGVIIMVKGGQTATTSDINGKYCLTTRLGETLVYSYLGYTNNYIEVTYKNSKPLSSKGSRYKENETLSSYSPIVTIITQEPDTLMEKEGVASFTPFTPSFQIINPNSSWLNINSADASKIKSIQINENKALISLIKDEYINIPHISFAATFQTENFNKLPEKQGSYAQGRPLNGVSQWRGPETGEIFSWGPAIENLEYTGSKYDFDKNGNLVYKGLGNGVRAKSYDPSDFFQIGRSFYANLRIHGKDSKKEYALTFSPNYKEGIIPKAYKKGYYLDVYYKRIFKNVTVSSKLFYDGSNGSLMTGSPALSLIMASVLTTPPTFDNANGFSGKDAAENSESYLLPNGEQRSYASGQANNPFWLVNKIKDKDRYSVLGASSEITAEIFKPLASFIKGSIQQQKYNNVYAYPLNIAGNSEARELNRSDILKSFDISAGLKYHIDPNNLVYNSQLSWNLKYTERSLHRTDYFIVPDSTVQFRNSPFQRQKILSWTNDFVLFRWFVGNISQTLLSGTMYKNKTLYSPSFSAGILFDEIFHFSYGSVNLLKLKFNWSKSYSDIPLAYTLGYYNYQNLPSSQYSNAFYNYETVADFDLNPEKTIKTGIGLSTDFFDNTLSLNMDLYKNKVQQGIFPVYDSNNPKLKNVADYSINGIELNLWCNIRNRYDALNGNFNISFSKLRTKVTEIYDNKDEIILSGYSDLHTSLVKGQPKGVIVGSTYKYNTNGEMIIGSDGFPLIDDKLHVIGNPTPDYIIGFESSWWFRKWSLNLLLEFRKGGEIWNGTDNALKYLGLAESTINDRKITEYIFSGVREDGTPNTIPVDFANHNNPLESNRWHKYGLTGVGEEGIEDASLFRIKEINLGYKVYYKRISYLISIFFHNPLIITKYSGVDPGSTLWGKPNTNGIDLFNSPGTSISGISVKIDL